MSNTFSSGGIWPFLDKYLDRRKKSSSNQTFQGFSQDIEKNKSNYNNSQDCYEQHQHMVSSQPAKPGIKSFNVNIKQELESFFSDLEMDEKEKNLWIEDLCRKIEQSASLIKLREKLAILYEFEEKYLGLLQQYQDEIKFANGIQEELRKERTKFFSDSLREVCQSLKESQVDDKVASLWIKELVESYTKSLNVCSDLIEVNTLEMIGKIRQEAKKDTTNLRTEDE